MENDNCSRNSSVQENDSILMVSAPGLRQDNLKAILSAVPGSPVLLCANAVEEAERLLDPARAALVIIDHTLGMEQMHKAVQFIRRLDKKTWIMLLAAHPMEAFTVEDFRLDAVLCDGFSFTDLEEMCCP
jgi:DNA-binding NarL/FixJ family response regulator